MNIYVRLATYVVVGIAGLVCASLGLSFDTDSWTSAVSGIAAVIASTIAMTHVQKDVVVEPDTSAVDSLDTIRDQLSEGVES